MRAPVPREPLHLRAVGWIFQAIDYLKSLADAEVARREDVGAVQREYEEHVHSPHADAFYLREMPYDFLVCHSVERLMPDSSIGEFQSEVFDVRSFLCGKPRSAHLSDRNFSHG